MKAQWKRLALLSATATMLAACGGGSSGNAPQNHAVPSGNNNNNAGNGNAADTMITGAYIHIINDTENDTEEVRTGNIDVHGDLNSLVIDGKKFQISTPNLQAHTFTSMSDSRYESLFQVQRFLVIFEFAKCEFASSPVSST